MRCLSFSAVEPEASFDTSWGCGSARRHSHGQRSLVNAVGSLAIGLFGGWASRFCWGEALRLSLTVGLCGGFTTFSTFSKESLALAEAGRWCAFAAYAIGSVAIGIAAVALGYWITRH